MSDDKTQIRQVPPAFALQGIAGASKDKMYPIDGELKVGREHDNDVIINEGFVSRHHATLQGMVGVLRITDHNSSNGTYVNGKAITTALLAPGDIVRFDTIEFVVRATANTEPLGATKNPSAELLVDSADKPTAVPLSADSVSASADDIAAEIAKLEAKKKQLEQAAAEQEKKAQQEQLRAAAEAEAKKVEEEKVRAAAETKVQAKKLAEEKARAEAVARAEVEGRAQDDDKTVIAMPPSTADVAVSTPDDDKTVMYIPPVSAPVTSTLPGDDDKTVIATPANFDDDATVVAMPSAGLIKSSTKSANSQPPLSAANTVELLGMTVPVDNRTFKLNKNVLTIGRSPLNDIILKSPSVSTHHAELRLSGEHWTVKDLGSSNGTFVNAQQVQECELYSRDNIVFGEVGLKFDPKGLAQSAPVNRVIESIEAATRRTLPLAWIVASVVAALALAVWVLL